MDIKELREQIIVELKKKLSPDCEQECHSVKAYCDPCTFVVSTAEAILDLKVNDLPLRELAKIKGQEVTDEEIDEAWGEDESLVKVFPEPLEATREQIEALTKSIMAGARKVATYASTKRAIWDKAQEK